MHGHPPLWARRPGFPTLVRIILEQQVSLASGKAIYRRISDALDGVSPQKIARRGTKGLRRLGVTRQKSAYLVALSEAILHGHVDLASIGRSSDDQARDALQAVKGIGPWTADVYLLMALRRPDIWPSGDLALHVAMERFLRLRARPTTKRATHFACRWIPWRSVAARILWHGYLSER
jgi:DNA-3-methyladenine glycosylase II